MNATIIRLHKSAKTLLILLITLGISLEVDCQFDQEKNNPYFFLKTLEYDSLAIAQLEPSKATRLYYVQDTFARMMKPLATMHCKTVGSQHNRLDNQFENISKKAIKLGLNSIKVDSAVINGISCEYWISLYRMQFDQIQINENIVKDNVLCVFGSFKDQNKPGNTFKINGRKVNLMPYEYVKRKIQHGKRGSVTFKGSRIELVGGIEGGEAFFKDSVNPYSLRLSNELNIGIPMGPLRLHISIPVKGKNSKSDQNTNLIPKTFAYFLYNIYNEKIVIANSRESLIAAKRKEWREKKAAEEAKKKAKEKNKNKDLGI